MSPANMLKRFEDLFPAWKYFADLCGKRAFREGYGKYTIFGHIAVEQKMVTGLFICFSKVWM